MITKTLACLILAFWCAPATAQTSSTTPAAESPYRQQVYELARKAEQETLVKSRPLYLDMVAAHDLDTRSYHFKARRWGDFLEVEVERGGVKFASAVNLSKAQEVKLVEGHPPDFNGVVYYYAYEEADNKDEGHVSISCIGGDCSRPNFGKPPSKGYHYAVAARNVPSIRKGPRPMVVESWPTGVVGAFPISRSADQMNGAENTRN